MPAGVAAMRAGTMTARVFPCFLASKLRRVSHWPLQRRRGIHWPMELGAADRGVAAIITILVVIFFMDLPDIEQLRAWAHGAGAWFIVVFWIGYVVLTLFPLPRTFWTVAA